MCDSFTSLAPRNTTRFLVSLYLATVRCVYQLDNGCFVRQSVLQGKQQQDERLDRFMEASTVTRVSTKVLHARIDLVTYREPQSPVVYSHELLL